MENLLWLYRLEHDPDYPVVCFDERPCSLIGERIAPRAMQVGAPKKEHYVYSKHGSCALLAAIEPLTGKRFAQVHRQRTKREYAQFCRDLAAQYPEAIKIRLVQDNLNTHTKSAFYELLPAPDAFALAQRFEFHYTPKAASWLNMVEIELSAIARGCLHQRIATLEELERQVLALVRERHEQRIPINWQFSIDTARTKFSRHYQTMNPSNPAAACIKT